MAEEPVKSGVQPEGPEEAGNGSSTPPTRPDQAAPVPSGPAQPEPPSASGTGKAGAEVGGRKRPFVLLGVVACVAIGAVLWFLLGRGPATRTDGLASDLPVSSEDAAALRDSVDLMPLIDPQTAVNGRWLLKEGTLLSDRTRETSIQIPWQPPDEYDLHIEFTRLEGNDCIRQSFRFGERTFHWLIAMADNTKHTFAPVGGKWDNRTTVTLNACLENGRRYASVVRVRAASVSATLNGKTLRSYTRQEKEEYGDPVQPGAPAVLGLATWGSPTAFHSIRVVEVTGKGKAVKLPWVKPPAVDDAFIGSVADLPPQEQLQRVLPALKEFNPGYDGQAQPSIYVGSLVGLSFLPGKVGNLSPLAALPLLTNLVCADYNSRTQALWDLSPLKGLNLVNVDFTNTNVAELSPLKGMKLRNLSIRGTCVADLSLLAGMPLDSLDCAFTPVSDLMPLRGATLKSLACNNTRVRHLTALRGLPLKRLDCSATLIRDIEPLQGLRLTHLRFSGSPVRSLEPLRGMPLTELGIQNTFVADLVSLKGLPLTRLFCGQTTISDLAPLAGMSLTELDLQGTPVRDLGVLKGMPLRRLTISDMPVSDLSPLAGTALRWLDMHGTKVVDLSPLKGMPLESLDLRGTKVVDLLPLQGMPLTSLDLRGIPATDCSAIKDCPLQYLSLDFKPERDAGILKSIRTLKSVNGMRLSELLAKTGG